MTKIHVEPCSDSRLKENTVRLPLHVSISTESDEPNLCSETSCDACACCNDTCGDEDCLSCTKKSQRRNHRGIPGEVGIFPFWSGAQPSASEHTYYTMCQLRRHCTEDSCWLLAGDIIYDATPYLKGKSHPGGEHSILKKSGGACDCKVDIQFHSKNARSMWKKYKIGKLRSCAREKAFTDEEFGADEQCTIT